MTIFLDTRPNLRATHRVRQEARYSEKDSISTSGVSCYSVSGVLAKQRAAPCDEFFGHAPHLRPTHRVRQGARCSAKDGISTS